MIRMMTCLAQNTSMGRSSWQYDITQMKRVQNISGICNLISNFYLSRRTEILLVAQMNVLCLRVPGQNFISVLL